MKEMKGGVGSSYLYSAIQFDQIFSFCVKRDMTELKDVAASLSRGRYPNEQICYGTLPILEQNTSFAQSIHTIQTTSWER